NAFKRQIASQLDAKIDALLVLGTTGESSTLDPHELLQIIEFANGQIKKRVPLIVGTGSNDTKKAIKLAKMAQQNGADSILVVTPYYNKCTQQGLLEHFKAIAQSVTLPVIIYNVPSRTGLNIAPETVWKLAKIKNVVALKEASGNINQIVNILHKLKKNFSLYSGDDGIVVPLYSMGSNGVISVLSNALPQQMVSLTTLCKKKDYTNASKLQLKLLPLIHAIFSEINPIGIKALLKILDKDSGILRLPLTSMSERNLIQVKKAYSMAIQ
ncbi:MAG: 4-hydroxy-tetrahydrodipicolinate synthase, partial [Clostridiales bacterium]|nr:4-hydroxy-tetrahydrodipicolinate synthase [Clostridiales bacterium]